MSKPKHKIRRGLTVTEVVVAATLVVSMIGLFAPMSVRIGRVWQSTRQYRLAFNELANQMERLTSLSPAECKEALSSLALPTRVSDALPGSQLLGEVIRDQDGTRLKLSLNWERGAASEPVSLTGWFDFTVLDATVADSTVADSTVAEPSTPAASIPARRTIETAGPST
jgi:hypothetical protein